MKLIGAEQIQRISAKFRHIPAGPHRVALIQESLLERLDSRLKQLASTETAQNELAALSIDEQLRIFNETVEPQDDKETRTLTLRYLYDRFAPAFALIENNNWLRYDRIGMRLLRIESLSSLEWLYLKMALTGLSNPYAKYVMIDEVQDYTAA